MSCTVARRFAALVTVLGFGLTACQQSLDLSAVTSLAKTVADAKPAAVALANDFYDTCVRGLAWDRGAAFSASPVQKIDPKKLKQLEINGDLSHDDLAVIKAAAEKLKISAENATPPEFVLSMRCVKNQAAAAQWAAANAIIFNYVAALGNLADEGATDFGVGNLVDAANKLSDPKAGSLFKTSDDQKKFNTSTNGLIVSFFNVRRRAALGADITKSNGDVQDLTKLLSETVVTDYVDELTQERMFMRRFFLINTSAIPVGLGRLQALQFGTNQLAEEQKIDQREAAAEAYRAIIKKIAQAHSDMTVVIAKDDLRSAVLIARGYADQLKPLIAQLQKATT